MINFEKALGKLIAGFLVILSIVAGLIAVSAFMRTALPGFFIAGIIAIGLFKFGSYIWREQSK